MKKLFSTVTNWEAWPFKVLYTPISFFWAWYILRSGNAWFFTSSNPKLTFGGMEGEPKKEMYDLLPAGSYPATFHVIPGQPIEFIEKKLHEWNISYPFIVKPDVAGQGILLRKICNKEELRQYHQKICWEYIVQSYVEYPIEVSVFYIRHPAQKKGIITGFLHKLPLQVVGNGLHPLGQLIELHPKANKFKNNLFEKHKDNWQLVIPAGEKYLLSYAANHTRGAKFIDLKEQINDELVSIFDEISISINDFYYGRYDIMCNSIEELKSGENFTILEYNGCGAEPNHFYDTGYTLMGAYKEILKHWKLLYQISRYNSRQGVPAWPLQKGWKFLADTRRKYAAMKALDAEIA